MGDEEVFPGFVYPAPKGHTQIPNLWYDEIVSQIDNVAELKIVLYVLRHTCGFQKAEQAQHLTVDEIMHGRLFNGTRFDRGTGLSEMSVRNGVKKAEDHGYIVSDTDTSNKARIGKCYKLRFSEVQNLDLKQEAEVQSLESGGINLRPPEVQNLEGKGTDFIPPSPGRVKERKESMKEREKDGDDSFIHSSSHSSLSDQKANVTAYLRMYMRKFLLEMGAAGNLMDEHLKYLQEVYYASELDKETFRFKAESIIDKTKEAKGDIDYFYDCLCTTLHLEQK